MSKELNECTFRGGKCTHVLIMYPTAGHASGWLITASSSNTGKWCVRTKVNISSLMDGSIREGNIEEEIFTVKNTVLFKRISNDLNQTNVC